VDDGLQHETVRVSDQVLAWLDDSSSVPEGQPHCQWCGTPKIERNRRCEVCHLYGSITGPLVSKSGVFVERYKPRRVIRIRRTSYEFSQ